MSGVIYNSSDSAEGNEWSEVIPAHDSLRDAHMVYFLLGGFICAFGLISHFLKERLYMSEAMVATVVGVLIGPLVAKQLSPAEKFGVSLDEVTLEFTRIVICIQCMACGVDLPGNYVWRERLSLFVLIGPALVLMWLITGVGVWSIVGGLSFAEALIIACCLTPTDPVLANSIVKGKFAEKYIPLNVRLILSAESGANDGLGTPLLFMVLYIQRSQNVGVAIGEWLYKVLLYQIILAVVVAAVLAHVAQIALKLAERKGLIDKESLLSFSIALAVFIMGLMSLLVTDDILAAFVAGNILTWDQWFNDKMRSSQFQEIIDSLINLTYFVYFGSIIPWSTMFSVVAPWKMAVLAVFILALRRIPVIFALTRWIPALEDTRQTMFAAWFGPMGASAIFYALLSTTHLGVPVHPLQEIVFFMVLTSVVVHGGSVPLFDMGLQRIESWRSGERPAWSWVWQRYTARIAARRREPVFNVRMQTIGMPRFDTGKSLATENTVKDIDVQPSNHPDSFLDGTTDVSAAPDSNEKRSISPDSEIISHIPEFLIVTTTGTGRYDGNDVGSGSQNINVEEGNDSVGSETGRTPSYIAAVYEDDVGQPHFVDEELILSPVVEPTTNS